LGFVLVVQAATSSHKQHEQSPMKYLPEDEGVTISRMPQTTEGGL